jgi:HEAT repeat protein
MLDLYQASLVRLFMAGGQQVAGAGVLVSETHLLTCTSVVTQAFGLPEASLETPTDHIFLDFPFAAPNSMLAARVVRWRPAEDEDVAILELQQALPEAAQPAPLVVADDLWQHQVQAYGFSREHLEGHWLSATIEKPQTTGRLPLGSLSRVSMPIPQDFHGVPVWDEQESGIVGMLLAAQVHSDLKQFVITPTLNLLRVWPVLRQAIHYELKAYLTTVMHQHSRLPDYFPAHLDFGAIHQPIRVIQDPPQYREEVAQTREADRRAGYFEEEERIYSWENPELRTRPKGAQRVLDWDKVRRHMRRVVVLADPGGGKSWLLHYEGRRITKAQLDMMQEGELIPDMVDVPIYLHLQTVAEALFGKSLSLDEVIVDLLEKEYALSRRFIGWARQQLFRSHCLLLLDALDEVEEMQKPLLIDAIKDFAERSHCDIILTSRIVGYQEAPFALQRFQGLPVAAPAGIRDIKHACEVEVLPFTQYQVTNFIANWFATEPEKKASLQDCMRRTPTLRALARLPLQLSLLCLTATIGETIPTRRVELYEAAVNLLLRRPWQMVQGQNQAEYPQEKIWMFLEHLAWHCATFNGRWRNHLPTTELGEYFQHISPTLPLIVGTSEQDGFLMYRVNRTKILRFLHPAFQEYLVARFLTRLPLEGWSEQVRAHCWFDHDWLGVIIFLSGCLQDPNRLLELLLHEPNDVFHAMVLLTGRCLVETTGAVVKSEHTAHLVQKLLAVLHSKSEHDRQHAIMVLGQLGELALPGLLTLLQDRQENPNVRSAAAEVLGEIGNLRTTEDLLTIARGKVVEPDEVRSVAVWALGHMRSLQAVQDLLHLLLDRSEVGIVRSAAAEALGTLDDPRAVEALFLALDDQTWPQYIHTLHPAAFDALQRLGKPAMDTLLRQTRHKRRQRRLLALERLAWIGDQQVVPALLAIVQNTDDHPQVRSMAAWTLGHLGGLQAFGPLITILQTTDEIPEMRSQAARALGLLGDRRAVETLLMVLWDKDPDMMNAVVEALGYLDDSRAVAEVQAILGGKGVHWEVRCTAAKVLGVLHDKRAIPELLAVLRNTTFSQHVRGEVAQALGQLGNPQVVEDLLTVLREDEKKLAVLGVGLHTQVIEALGHLRNRRAVEGLLTALHSSSSLTREQTVKALGCIGGQGVVDALLQKLENRGEFHAVRQATIEALGHLGDPRVTEVLLQEVQQHPQRTRPVTSAYLGTIKSPEDTIVALNCEEEGVVWTTSKDFLMLQFRSEQAVEDFLTEQWNLNEPTRKNQLMILKRTAVRALEELIPVSDPMSMCDRLLEVWWHGELDDETQVLLYELLAQVTPRLCMATAADWPSWRMRLMPIIERVIEEG